MTIDNMMIGKTIKRDRVIYVYVNKQGTLEKLGKIKWYAELWLEILQGLNKNMTLENLRIFCNKYKK